MKTVSPEDAMSESNHSFKFLIIGAGRGGSSLLAGLLDSHSKLEVGFELFAIKYLMGKSFLDRIFQRKKFIIHDRTGAFKNACIRESKKFPGKLWGNKITTEQIFGLEDQNIANPKEKVDIIDFFFRKSMNDIKIIFIIRDGRTCVCSKVKRTGQPFVLACERWNFSVQVYRYLKESHNNNINVKFEELLKNPRQVLENICGFLSIPFEEKMLKGTRNEKMLPEYRKDTFDLSKIELENISDEDFTLIQDGLKFCNYI